MRSLRGPSSISATPTEPDRALAGAVGVEDAGPAHDQAAGREVGALDELHEVVGGGVGVGQQVLGGVDDLAQVVGRDVGGHAHRDALAAVDQQVGEPGRQHLGLLHLARVVVVEVDGVLVDVLEHAHGDGGQAALGVAGGRRRVVERAEVALGVHERVAQAEGLAHAHQGVVDRAVAVGVVLAHDVAGDPGALHGGPVGPGPHVVHAPEDAAVHRLQAVARVGQGPRHDDRHGVVEEGPLHLLLDLDGLDAAEVDGRAVAVVGRWWGGVAHACGFPRVRGLRCRGSARPWRWSG